MSDLRINNGSTVAVTGSARAAFTLVELLVVIGIITVLISILLPAFNRARAQAYEVQCQSNLRQFGAAFQTYANDNNGNMPWEGASDGNVAANAIGPWNDPWLWINALPPLVGQRTYYQIQQDDKSGVQPIATAGSNNIFVCPSAQPPIGDAADLAENVAPNSPVSPDGTAFYLWGNTPTQDGTATGAGSIPQYVKLSSTSTSGYPSANINGIAQQQKFFSCYVFNSKLNDSIVTTAQPYIEPKYSRLTPSSEVPTLVERMVVQGELQIPGPYGFSGSTIDLNRGKTTWSRFAARHTNGGNMLFADGHVAWFAREDLVPQAGTMYSGDVTGKAKTSTGATVTGNTAWNLQGKVTWDPFQLPLYGAN